MARVNDALRDGRTPLYTAAANGHKDCVSELVCRNANINLSEEDGTTALWIAAHRGHHDVVKMLLSVGSLDVLAHQVAL